MPIRVIPFDGYKQRSEFPRYPDNRSLTLHLEEGDARTSFFVFISHCWVAGNDKSSDWRGRPHPDNLSNDKFYLTVKAIEQIWQALAPGILVCVTVTSGWIMAASTKMGTQLVNCANLIASFK
jgi:hypothetical protein